jgi:2-polyprenyl-3-methyl-5-hydroxy-6-metoxy-1,4-benzoquinol methylase
MDDQEIQQALQRYRFYHVIPLTEKLQTPGWQDPTVLRTQKMVKRALDSLDFKGKRVLDVGCRDGLFSFEAEKRGASDVIGIDNDLSQGATEFLIPFFKSRVQMHQRNLYDLTPEMFGTFDVVICPGVLYHLRFPFLALKRISEVLRDDGQLVLETAIWADASPLALLHCPVGSESPYEPTSCTFFNPKALADSLKSFGLAVQSTTYLENHLQRLNEPWERFRNRLRAFRGRHKPPAIDRAVLVCRRAALDPTIADSQTQQYWYETHRHHTA